MEFEKIWINEKNKSIDFICKKKFYKIYFNNEWFMNDNTDFIVFKQKCIKKWDYVLVWWSSYYYIRAEYICSFWWTHAIMMGWKLFFINKISYIDKRWLFKRIYHFITGFLDS